MEADLINIVKEATASNQRRMIVLAGKAVELAPLVAKIYVSAAHSARVLFAADSLEEGSLFKALTKSFPPELCVQGLLFEETDEVLGTTWDLLFMDLTEQLRPNDLGRLVELVRGGGIVVMLTPPLSEWPSRLTKFQRKLVVPPYTEGDLKKRFVKRFVKKLLEHPGIYVVNGEPPGTWNPPPPSPHPMAKPTLPSHFSFPREIYELAKTQDQVEALKSFEALLEGGRRTLILTANRGRGKSAVLGLGAAGLMCTSRRALSIKVTAPEPRNVETVFEFASKALRERGVKVKVREEDGCPVLLQCKLGTLEYHSPYGLIRRSADLAMVDEAAGIPLPLLFKVLRKFKKTVYSSTIHGYEGAGRGFGLRFLKALSEEGGVDVERVELRYPIRYAPNDPVEAWLYDALFLDAEPPRLEEVEKAVQPDRCIYEEPDLDKWFLEEEARLKEFIGIYVFAHYRNRPDDVALLGDAPHHRARVLRLPGGKVAVALHLAEEGAMLDEEVEKLIGGYKPPGNVIPVCVARYYLALSKFAKLRGLRVVRIATHPELMNRGLGTRALLELCREAELAGYDWVGAGFGASYELVNFWLRNSFIPVHLSPTRNLVSGEFSVVVVRPLSQEAKEVVDKVNREFKARLIEALADSYFNLEASVARQLLNNVTSRRRLRRPRLTKSQLSRLTMYVLGTLTYEASCDAIKELLRAHFLSTGPARMSLPAASETLLISKCLQGKPWSRAASASGIDPTKVKKELREVVRGLYKFYLGKAERHSN
ncbi:MAG: tRNA(Met) cytidine acetyltransferase TmcA [Candidatus Nezhaarchaeota archaeon]|nr:tRNA(Met) cytidine acetyltransferase TmcA [Candidatus Nezhaarchaeota archaeon]